MNTTNSFFNMTFHFGAHSGPALMDEVNLITKFSETPYQIKARLDERFANTGIRFEQVAAGIVGKLADEVMIEVSF